MRLLFVISECTYCPSAIKAAVMFNAQAAPGHKIDILDEDDPRHMRIRNELVNRGYDPPVFLFDDDGDGEFETTIRGVWDWGTTLSFLKEFDR